MLAHLDRARGAVDADDVDLQRVDRGERCADLGAGKHASGELDRDLRLDRYLAPGGRHRPPGPDRRGLQPEQVELGLDDQQVDAALEQRGHLDLVRVAELGEADLAERGELGARAHRTGHEALAVGSRVVVGHLAGDASVGQGDLVRPLGHVVLAERDGERSEGVRLHDVGADVEVGGVEACDDVGTGDAEQLVAAFERLTAEVVGGQVLALEPGSGSAVVHDDALVHEFEEIRHGLQATVALSRQPQAPPPPGSVR